MMKLRKMMKIEKKLLIKEHLQEEHKKLLNLLLLLLQKVPREVERKKMNKKIV